ncbi:hypothetical protein P8918_13220 [Bacillus spizizenii]|nr:hypothetical protein [Bacillus spizizenii]MEC0841987.1 hypothetical protein [Bacillus spizizenii]
MNFLPIGRLRIKHEELEKAREEGVDLIAKRQEEIRKLLEQVRMEPVFKLVKRPPPYVILKKHRKEYKSSVNFRIYTK